MAPGDRSGTGSKINPTPLGAHLLQPASPSSFLMMPIMIMTIIMVMAMVVVTNIEDLDTKKSILVAFLAA